MLGAPLMLLLTVNLAMCLVGFSVNLMYQYSILLGRASMDMTLTGRSASKLSVPCSVYVFDTSWAAEAQYGMGVLLLKTSITCLMHPFICPVVLDVDFFAVLTIVVRLL